jgi:hypothetical protein
MSRLVLVVLLGGAACQPPSRSASYFEAHPTEAAKVVQACGQGGHRSHECEAAQVGHAAAQATARQNLFRRGFQ